MALVRPGAAGLLIDIECSRVRDNSWMYLTSFVTIRIGIESNTRFIKGHKPSNHIRARIKSHVYTTE